jgi:hypothetical protein
MDSSRKKDPPSEVAIKRAKNKGYIVRHSFDNFGRGESYRPPEEHAFTTHKEMMAHVHKHTHDGGREVDPGERKPAGVGHVPRKGAAPTAQTRGAGLD